MATNYLLEHIDKLPSDLKTAVLTTNYLSALHNIQSSRKLHIDQAASLERLTFMLMLGEIDETQYLERLSKELYISDSVAEEIGNEVQTLVLEPILKKFQLLQTTEGIPKAGLINTNESNVVQKQENHSLTAESILAEIENPTPSIPVITPDTSSKTTTSIAADAVLSTTQAAVTTPSITPTTIQTLSTNPATPEVKPVVPSAAILKTLNSKLDTTSVAVPTTTSTELRPSIDPYREPVE